VIARKIGAQVRLYSRPGNDLTERSPLIVETLANLRTRSCIIEGEAVACDDNGLAVFDPRARYRRTMTRSSWLPTQEDSSELLLIAEPVLGLRNRRSERLCDSFLCDQPRSLDGRERNDGADCAHADECDSERNNQSNGELLAAGHGGPPSFEGPWVRHMRG
jgi:ATP dependent DNA ligase-like protein